MQLLAVALPHHDANLAWFDGDVVRYVKLERLRQEKRFHLPALPDWKQAAEEAWGPHAAAADDFVFSFDPASLPPALRRWVPPEAMARLATGALEALPLAPALCEYLGVPRGWLASHHWLHALSTWMLEPEPAPVRIVIDGVGDGRAWSVYRDDALAAVGPITQGSIGWGMREAGKLLGIRYGHYNDIAGKLMGLQAYGRVDTEFLRRLAAFGMDALGELWSPRHWEAHCGDALVARLTLLDWAATVHRRTGDLLVDFFREHVREGERVSYSGGVAQNVLWNARLAEAFPDLVVPPHASDEGLSLGGLEWLRRRHQQPAFDWPAFPFAQSDTAVEPASDRTTHHAAQVLAQGRLVGWYQGAGEVGPRALGHRSILMDPRLPQGKALLNRVKQREPYRPFGASVLAEHHDTYFDGVADAFMLKACRVRGAGFPAITHVDGSSRVQAVTPGGSFHALLAHFHALTGCPVLAHTSLNLAGRPLAGFPDNALALLRDSPLDALVVGDQLHLKQAPGAPAG
jgi:carbamoyltransferase